MNRYIISVASLLVAGCTTSGNLFSASSNPTASTENTTTTIDGSGLAIYLQVIDDLINGDTVTQSETFQRVNLDAANAPNTTNRLKLALALAIPGHSGSNAEHAQRELRELLAASDVLLPEERIIAALQLAQIERRLLLDLEAKQTQTAAVQSIEQQTSDAEQRVRLLQDENRALRIQLEDAQNILDEIADIESSIRDRESSD